MTRRIFTPDVHDPLRDTCRRFFAERVVPFHAEWERNSQVSREVREPPDEG
jgi:long-chain-acyl-CoA dehydrogenase